MVWLRVIDGTLELIILFIMLELLQRRREIGYQPLGLAKDRRPLKPRSPLDCPVCQHPHPKPLWGHAHKSGVEPWPRRVQPLDDVDNSGQPRGAAALTIKRHSLASHSGWQWLFSRSCRPLLAGHGRRWENQDLQHRPALVCQACGLSRGARSVALPCSSCG
jgi:hypothetical protein